MLRLKVGSQKEGVPLIDSLTLHGGENLIEEVKKLPGFDSSQYVVDLVEEQGEEVGQHERAEQAPLEGHSPNKKILVDNEDLVNVQPVHSTKKTGLNDDDDGADAKSTMNKDQMGAPSLLKIDTEAVASSADFLDKTEKLYMESIQGENLNSPVLHDLEVQGASVGHLHHSIIPDSQVEGTQEEPGGCVEVEPEDNATQEPDHQQVEKAMNLVGEICSDVYVPSQPEEEEGDPGKPLTIQTDQDTQDILQEHGTAVSQNIQRFNIQILEWTKDKEMENVEKVTKGEYREKLRKKIVSSVMAPPGVPRPDLGSSSYRVAARTNLVPTANARVEGDDNILLSGLHDTAECVEPAPHPQPKSGIEQHQRKVPPRRSTRLQITAKTPANQGKSLQKPDQSKTEKTKKTTRKRDADPYEFPGADNPPAIPDVKILNKPHPLIATAPTSSEVAFLPPPERRKKGAVQRDKPKSSVTQATEDQTIAEYVQKHRSPASTRSQKKVMSMKAEPPVVGCSKCRYKGCRKCREKVRLYWAAVGTKSPGQMTSAKMGTPSKKSKPEAPPETKSPAALRIFNGKVFLVSIKSNDEKQRVTEMIQALGGKVESSIPEYIPTKNAAHRKTRATRNSSLQKSSLRKIFTVVASSACHRTFKSMYAKVSGTPIVTPEWVDACVKRKKVLPLSDDATNVIYGEQSQVLPLRNLEIHIVLAQKNNEVLKHLLQHAGAKVLSNFQPGRDSQNCDLILIGTDIKESKQLKEEASSISRMARSIRVPCRDIKWLADGLMDGNFSSPISKKHEDTATLEEQTPPPRAPKKRSRTSNEQFIKKQKTDGDSANQGSTPQAASDGLHLLHPCPAPDGLPSSAVRSYYETMHKYGEKISIGDYVELVPNFGEANNKICKVLGLWLQHGLADGAKPFGKFQRFYRLEETSLSGVFDLAPNSRKICRSSHIEDNVPLSAVLSKCTVETLPSGSSPAKDARMQTNDCFYCTADYNHETGIISPLLGTAKDVI